MTHATLTATTATPARDAGSPTVWEMLEEVMDLGAGLAVGLLPFILLSVPAIVLFVVLPAVLLLVLALPLAVIGAVLAGPPYLLVRRRRGRRL